MKQLSNYIIEKFKINSKTSKQKVLNKIEIDKLKHFTKEDVEKIIDWINIDMSEDIRPIIVTNVRKFADWSDSSVEIFLFYTEDYEKSKGFDIPYIKFYYDGKELNVCIYDNEDTKYYNSATYSDCKDLDKCFDFIEKKHDIIKKLI